MYTKGEHQMIAEDIQRTLIEAAKLAKKHSYVPYSKFSVGAAILTEDGDIVTGCNIENVSYGLSNCGERTAIFNMVSEKGPVKIKAIAISTTPDIPCAPCGACRQVIQEFSTPETLVIYKGPQREYMAVPLLDLLPGAFSEFTAA